VVELCALPDAGVGSKSGADEREGSGL